MRGAASTEEKLPCARKMPAFLTARLAGARRAGEGKTSIARGRRYAGYVWVRYCGGPLILVRRPYAPPSKRRRDAPSRLHFVRVADCFPASRSPSCDVRLKCRTLSQFHGLSGTLRRLRRVNHRLCVLRSRPYIAVGRLSASRALYGKAVAPMFGRNVPQPPCAYAAAGKVSA